jgi:hypothetical protein
VLAVCVMRDWSSVSRLEISVSPPSAMLTTWSARSAFPIAAAVDAISLRRFWEAIRPAGSSLPRLIRRPVLSRSSEVFRARLFCPSTRCPMSEGTFVLMRVM